MGYHTAFKLKVEPEERTREAVAVLKELSEGARRALEENGDTLNSCKWVDCDYDLCRLSRLFPDVTFILSGMGESRDDVWELYFINGKYQYLKAELVMPALEPTGWADWSEEWEEGEV